MKNKMKITSVKSKIFTSSDIRVNLETALGLMPAAINETREKLNKALAALAATNKENFFSSREREFLAEVKTTEDILQLHEKFLSGITASTDSLTKSKVLDSWITFAHKRSQVFYSERFMFMFGYRETFDDVINWFDMGANNL